MSRKSEIAQSLLHRYYAQQYSLPTTRPRSIKSVKDLKDAERFRNLCIQEISAKVTKINDTLVTESQIRDLNDDLNKLMKEKKAWEFKIKELGGPDYLQFKRHDDQTGGGLVVRGYRYFGRAKELPDVVKLVELTKQEMEKDRDMKLTRKNDREVVGIVNRIEFSPTYYGLNDDEYDFNDDQDEDFVDAIPSNEDVLRQLLNVLGSDALPENILNEFEVERLNESNGGNSQFSELRKFERRKTRSLQKSVTGLESENREEERLIGFDEVSDASALDLKQVEKFIVQKRKEKLLARIKQQNEETNE